MLRADLPADSVETPVQALEYARFMRHRDVGYDVFTTAYQYGVAMFRDVLGIELPLRISDEARIGRIAIAADDFLFTYIATVLERLQREFDTARQAWHPHSSDEILQNPASVATAQGFRDGQIAAGRWLAASPEVSGAHAESEALLDEFVATMREASFDEDLSDRLALADTSVQFVLADEPDLAVTLHLDRTPIEVDDRPAGPAEINLRIASFDLAQLGKGDFKLAMAIAHGRVASSGPVRKFLRVVPVLTRLAATHEKAHAKTPHATTANGATTHPVEEPAGNGSDTDGAGFDEYQRGLLDEAAEFRHHKGALAVEEKQQGDFWSVEVIDVYKTFGKNRVLRGLTLGIPEGMITVILGPSGTGKSVLINHLIGLMFPDRGDIIVHGRSVPDRRRSELFEMRRDFGILFQDGALFGSLNVYDNVAFPLREQTNKSEEEIRKIVTRRLEEVGLAGAAYRMPNEISGGMKKRAGFARALVLNPDIVMFDEPDSGLDPVRTALLCELIEKVHAEHGGTYIVITHNIAAARQIAEYIIVVWKGRIVQSGDKEDMLTSPNPFVRQFLAGRPRGPLGME
jgi:phospholipid/cholesterol/gamma-HCH transport system ATP-binding protein